MNQKSRILQTEKAEEELNLKETSLTILLFISQKKKKIYHLLFIFRGILLFI
jgi:hypothetical protein